MRQWILVGLLVVMMGAFAYDKLVAAKQWKAAWDQISEIETGPRPEITTNQMVQDRIQRLPAKTYSPDGHPNMVVERYSWRRGLLFATNDIYVVYAKSEPKEDDSVNLYYYSASFGTIPGESNFPRKTVVPSSVPEGEKPTDDSIRTM